MPGVPPDAMNTLKKAFKGLFKRGKKSKEDQTTATTTQQQSSQPTSSTPTSAPPVTTESASTPTTSAAAPQLPPVQSSSPLQSPEAEESSKALPPTHPLATGPQSQPQEAVPINHDAQPGPPTGTTPLAPIDTADLIREQEKPSQIVSDLPPRIPVDTSVPIGEQSQTSAAVGSAVTDGAKDDLSPALQNSAPTAAPQTTTEHIGVLSAKENEPIVAPLKTDGAIDGASTLNDKPVTDPSLPAPVGGVPSSNTAVTDATLPQPVGGQPATNGVSATTPTATKTAPGMSATSGPLEDFPDGGVQEEQHI